MLIHLHIKNIALIEELNLDLHKGLNILTGETGAGKSIIIGSINAILGGRVSKELIRTGKDRALVEIIYSGKHLNSFLKEMSIEPEENGEIIVSREIFLSGRNICKINGALVTVSALKKLGEKLIDIHGQHDNQSLLRTENHIELLDSFSGDEFNDLKISYSKNREKFLNLKNELENLQKDIGEREKKIDILKYQIEEIEMANIEVGEDDSLVKDRSIQLNAEKIIYSLSAAHELLSNGNEPKIPARDLLDSAVYEISLIENLDEKYERIKNDIENILYTIDDISDSIRAEKEEMEFDSNSLDEINQRLDLINGLKRKYGSNIEEILKYFEDSKEELNKLENIEESTFNLNQKLIESEKKLLELAYKMHLKREGNAKFIENKIKDELKDLEIKDADFKVDIIYEVLDEGNNFKDNGLDKVEFLISTNKGEPLKPLSKIASGGEMSRIMLAIKKILAQVDDIETLIFDEIDTGISGIAAQKVGKKLNQISKNHQVICVTHLPQIASMANNHFNIKKITDDKTITTIKKLNYEEKIREIARLLAGDNSNITTKLAKDMLEKSNK
jgi:DNA repair protein RecN (Recombination protein N)